MTAEGGDSTEPGAGEFSVNGEAGPGPSFEGVADEESACGVLWELSPVASSDDVLDDSPVAEEVLDEVDDDEVSSIIAASLSSICAGDL